MSQDEITIVLEMALSTATAEKDDLFCCWVCFGIWRKGKTHQGQGDR